MDGIDDICCICNVHYCAFKIVLASKRHTSSHLMLCTIYSREQTGTVGTLERKRERRG